MNTLEIREYLKKISHSLQYNVFAANCIPMHISTPVYMISNLDPSTKPGSHWVAIFIDINGIGEYFDTFGRKPNGYQLSFLRRNTYKWTYNNKIIQNIFTSLCGEYCLIYLYFRLRGITLENFVNFFDDNTFNNDILLSKMFQSFFM